MSLSEYGIRKEGALLKEAYRMGNYADLALMIRAADSADRQGRYLIKNSFELFDVKAAEQAILGNPAQEEKKWQELERLARRQQEWEVKHGRN